MDLFASAAARAAPKSAPWRAVSRWAMVRGEYSICQYGVAPNEQYGLFGAGPQMLAHGKTYQEMMEKADVL